MTGRRWLDRLLQEWLLLVFAVLALVLALLDPQPAAAWRRWLQVPTLAGLTGLLVAIQGIRDSGLVQHAAAVLVARTHSLRTLGLLLVTGTAVLSMALTNDVSLFLLVPLTVAIGGMSNLPVLRMVVLEALAVNAGSTLSPIGNPQNLLLWQHGGLSFLQFAWAMLPAAMVMFTLVAALTWAWLPHDRVALAPEALDRRAVRGGLATLSLGALAAMVVLMEYGQALSGAALLLAVFALVARRSLARLDWLLLLTFAVIFLSLGHLAELPQVHGLLARVDFGQPLHLYLAGILASQLISNVPATVLLLEHARDPVGLAVAVNVGGFGAAIGSLANLIALRLARQPQGLRQLHRVSIPFLLTCAPLVYLVWRWLG
ncbi:SLC13 family permease [Fulvimonas yonginensis]|uniref:SLC13 family permease n=1 Tax=Fulvimonas yonginensis TaxID=1495200 RepID=A0ABU8JAQ7_9GAMM